jgi:hypothetical protein
MSFIASSAWFDYEQLYLINVMQVHGEVGFEAIDE